MTRAVSTVRPSWANDGRSFRFAAALFQSLLQDSFPPTPLVT
jgi:hypothetical protein